MVRDARLESMTHHATGQVWARHVNTFYCCLLKRIFGNLSAY